MKFLEQTRIDILEDLSALRSHANNLIETILLNQKYLQEKNTYLYPQSNEYLEHQFEYLYNTCKLLLAKVDSLTIPSELESEKNILNAIIEKSKIHEEIRILQALVASATMSDKWQAPNSYYSIHSQAGTLTKKVQMHISDYTRDGGWVAFAEYEKKFLKEYIDKDQFGLVEICVTSSGMSAFLIAMLYIQNHYHSNECILIASSTYFQNRNIAEMMFKERLIYFDENNIDEILTLVQKYKPCGILLTSISNASPHSIPALAQLIPQLYKSLPVDSCIILDNTCASIMFQPLLYVPIFSRKKLIVIESLSKYHHFGFDRTTAGIIWSHSATPLQLNNIRRDSGGIISDVGLASLPTPNRKILEQRLKRMNRNAQLMTKALSELPNITIEYPGLENHPGYAWTKDMVFQGGSFSITFNFVDSMLFNKDNRLAQKLLRKAQLRGIQLNVGVGFGYDVTRIYPLSFSVISKSGTKNTLRVSNGTETTEEVQDLIQVFIDILNP